MDKNRMQKYGLAILLCLTLGLAPFLPEPHLVKQWQNFQNGTLTEPIDIFDVFLHGAPFLYLIYLGLSDLFARLKG